LSSRKGVPKRLNRKPGEKANLQRIKGVVSINLGSPGYGGNGSLEPGEITLKRDTLGDAEGEIIPARSPFGD